MKILLLLASLLSSCAYLPRPASVPLKTLSYGNAKGKELVVFLPGRWSLPGEFEKNSFVEIAASTWPDARIVVPDLHLGYYENQTAARRLHEDVIVPKMKDGVKTIRLVGISMGGMGSLVYDLEHPGIVSEIWLLSPFLGEDEAIEEIKSAGGLRKWDPGKISQEDFSRKLWTGLRAKWSSGTNRPVIRLGCGTEDRLAGSSRLFAREFLTEADQTWISGAHDWPTWKTLFGEMARKY